MERNGENEKGFKIEDKRRFTPEGEPKETAKKEDQSKEEKKEAKKEIPPLPPVDFISFVISLASSAQVHLGFLPNPQDGKIEKNLPLAKQTIDVLGILEEKTKGNLSKEEGEVLREVLHQLRLQFVEVNK